MGRMAWTFFLLFFSFFVRISSFTFPFGCGVCLTLGFGNMTERRNSECHHWHIPLPFFLLVRLSFLDTWLIVTAVYWGYFIWKRIRQWNVNELEFFFSFCFFFFFYELLFITGQQFWTFFKVTHPNSTVCNELIIAAMSLKSHTFFNQCAWNRSFLKGILFFFSAS